jgi:group I intron endonuclease
MRVSWKDHQLSGIYCIRNIKNRKVYIGKSRNIARRISSHVSALRRKDCNSENSHFIRAWWKYGSNSFEYFIVEIISSDQENYELIMKERELFWMNVYKSTYRGFGYNLRMDSSTRMIIHTETIEKLKIATKGKKNGNYGNKWTEEMKKNMSEKKKEMYRKGIHKKLTIEQLQYNLNRKKEKWEKDPSLIQKMVDKCNLTKIKYEIHQFTKEGDLVYKWKDILELMSAHPEYKKHNIYAVCSGEKPSMYGYKWVKVSKI